MRPVSHSTDLIFKRGRQRRSFRLGGEDERHAARLGTHETVNNDTGHSDRGLPVTLGWHLSRCHLTPVPGLVMPNASGCAVVALSAPLADSMPAVPLARAGVVPPFVCINRFNTRTDFPRIGVCVQSCAPFRLWGQRPVDFLRLRVGVYGRIHGLCTRTPDQLPSHARRCSQPPLVYARQRKRGRLLSCPHQPPLRPRLCMPRG